MFRYTGTLDWAYSKYSENYDYRAFFEVVNGDNKYTIPVVFCYHQWESFCKALKKKQWWKLWTKHSSVEFREDDTIIIEFSLLTFNPQDHNPTKVRYQGKLTDEMRKAFNDAFAHIKERESTFEY